MLAMRFAFMKPCRQAGRQAGSQHAILFRQLVTPHAAAWQHADGVCMLLAQFIVTNHMPCN
jgi:hypothetical protein